MGSWDERIRSESAYLRLNDEMIAWKSGGTKIYQQLPEDCYNTLQKCEPLREIPADRPPQITNFKPWKETKK